MVSPVVQLLVPWLPCCAQVHVLDRAGSADLIATQDEEPTYKQVGPCMQTVTGDRETRAGSWAVVGQWRGDRRQLGPDAGRGGCLLFL